MSLPGGRARSRQGPWPKPPGAQGELGLLFSPLWRDLCNKRRQKEQESGRERAWFKYLGFCVMRVRQERDPGEPVPL